MNKRMKILFGVWVSAFLFAAPLSFTDDRGESKGFGVAIAQRLSDDANLSNVSDTTPPWIRIASPRDGDTVYGRVQVLFESLDVGGIDKFELYVDGVLKSTLLSTASNLYFMWNARKESAGSHTLVCRAYDRAGNVGTSDPVMVYCNK